ncbi:MAG TPA: Ppx/GppA phosphatase family protein [Solirubrobacteraceae bacterium]|nr:Ppx/GppA phosphatase family protein [Solirubrobacteraceae bacterium]
MRVASVDIGSNSTRLLVADVDRVGASVERELSRRSRVTRLGAGVDASGRLSEEAQGRVFETLSGYREEIDRYGCEANLAVLTSAVRDAANGREFADRVRDDFGLDARVLEGEQEAQLTFMGAMSGRERSRRPTVVIDVGGGSTEFVVGEDHTVGFHTSLNAGVVRMSERHIHSDPPDAEDLRELAEDVREVFSSGLPADVRRSVSAGIAVAGTATSAASIDQRLDPYDPERVDGYPLPLETVDQLLVRLSAMDEAQRREVVGLHPDRAPTIVAGMIILGEAIGMFGLDQVQVSEHDILYGAALVAAGAEG